MKTKKREGFRRLGADAAELTADGQDRIINSEVLDDLETVSSGNGKPDIRAAATFGARAP